MINSNKRWLLTASPWMKYSYMLSPFGIGGVFLCALLLFGSQKSTAQTHFDPNAFRSSSLGTGSRFLTVITSSGSTNICIGNTDTLRNSISGGVWTSSNPLVGSIDPVSGVVTGLSGGSTLINYTLGSASSSILITVTFPISGAHGVCVGNYLVLTDGTPTGLWTSNNTSVATVDVSGNVYGVGAGTAIITYGRTGGCAVMDTVTVGNNTIAAITGPVTGALAVCQGGTVTLNDATSGGSWSSSNTAIATIGGTTGIVSGVLAGAATVTYTVGGCYTTHPLIVTAPGTLTSITGANNVCAGDTIMLTDATTSGTWSSNNTSVAIINAAGVVNGLTTGTATINYYKLGCIVSKTVTVNVNTIAAISGNTNLCIGQTTSLSDATAGGAWSINNVSLATIGSTGTVTGVAAGSPFVTYTAGGCYITLGLTVNTSSVVVGAISGSVSLCQGTTMTLSDPMPGGTWAASNTSATVNAYGMVTGITAVNVYNGVDTVTYTRLGCSLTQVITVNPLPAAITGNARECLNGGTTTLADATPGGTWSTTNASVSTVGTGGIVTGVATSGLGTAYDTIKYTLLTGCYVMVSDTAYGPAAIVGGHTACTGPFVYTELHDPTMGGTWASSNIAVGTVNSSTGAVGGVSAGTTNVTYTVTFSGLNCYVINQVTVNVGPGEITGNGNACIGSTTALADITTGGIWSSSNTAIGSVGSTGIVTGTGAGGVIITYTTNGCSVTKNVAVSAPPTAIFGNSFTVCSGFGTQTIYDTTLGGTWSESSSSNIIMAASGSTGELITGIAVGTTTVSYTVGACAVTQVITVSTVNPAGAITGTTNTLCTGTTQLITDANAGGVWSSSNSAVVSATGTTASISVSALAAGTAVVSYTMSSSGCFKTWVYTVDRAPSAIYKTIAGIPTICGDSTLMLYDTTAGGNWSTSNYHIATVGTNGAVFGVAAGHATVTYAMPGGCISFMPVTVNDNPGSIGIANGVSALCFLQNDTATLTDPSVGGAWTSSNTLVGTIGSVAGILTGTGVGSTTITYTIGTCFVTKAISVGNLIPTINATPVSVCANGSASAALVAGTGYTPAGGKWTSGNALIASVGTNGAVTGVAAGTVIMTYTAANSGCYTTQTETVFSNTMPAITGGTAVCVGSVTNLTDAAGILTGKWSSSNTSIGTIGAYTGVYTASPTVAGSTIITYTDTSAGGCKQWASINVGSVIPAAITATLNAVCAGGGTIMTDGTAGGAWTVDNTTVALVNSTGGVQGLTPGTANVSYTIGGCPASTVISVNAAPTITGTFLECEGTSTNTLIGTPGGGTWTSSKATVATIGSSSGTINAIYYGTSTINYIINAGCIVSVTDTVSSDTASITGGASVICNGLAATLGLSPNEADGFWTSGNEALATVNSGGLVTALGSGTVTISYASYGNCATATKVVTVNSIPFILNDPSSMCLSDNTVILSDATTGGAWTSSNNAVGTIGTSGQITGISAGTTNITYTVGSCYVTAPITIITCPTPPGATSVNNVVSTQVFTLFPNPSNGNITITQSVAIDETMQVSVMNQVGAVVYTGTIDFSSGRSQMNMSDVTPGLYLVLLQNKKGANQTFKVLIEK